MEFLNKQYSQLRDLVLSMSPGNRITVIMLGVLLLISLAFLVVGVAKSDSEFIYVGNGRLFNMSQQLAIDSALGKAGLTGYSWDGMKLKVPRTQVNKFAAAIFEAKAVTELGSQLDKTVNGLGVYESGKMMDQKMLVAKGQELSNVISSYGWVESAIVMPDSRVERDPKIFYSKTIRSASVSITPVGFVPLTEEQVSGISQLVAGSLGITDLKEIRIIDSRNQESWIGNDLKTKGTAKTYEEQQQAYESNWEKKIRGLFPDIQGMWVKTTVELDKSLGREEHDVAHGPAIAVATRERSTDLDKRERNWGARPGLTPQGGLPVPNANATVIEGGYTKEKTEENEVQKALSGVEGKGRIAGLTPKYVTATIRIPLSYIRQVWTERNPQSTTEPTMNDLEIVSTEVTQMVRSSVGQMLAPYRPSNMVDISQMVTVATYNDPAPKLVAPPTFSELLQEWLAENWQTLALLGLVGGGVFVLWSLTRVKKAEPIVIYEAPELPPEMLETTAGEEEEVEEMSADRRLEPFSKSMKSLQHEVTELVTENPDAAVNVLRQWIGNLVVQE
ncbi:MAG: hypothetical protein ACRC10_02415 [Thermoguttaceae bacterium]